MNWQDRPKTFLVIVGVALACLTIPSYADENAQTPPAPVQTESIPTAIARPGDYQTSRSYQRPKAPVVKEKKKAEKKPVKVAPKPKPVVVKPKPQKPTSSNVTLACLREHESNGHYDVVSELRGDTRYYGAYQFSGKYMAVWAKRYGHGAWASKPANLWPAGVQDDVALQLGLETSPDWEMWSKFTSYSCPGF